MTVRNLQPETAELLRCVFHGQDPSWPKHVSEQVFFQEVTAQGMSPLLFRMLAEKRGRHRPQNLLNRLREAALRQSAIELVLEADLRQLLTAFARIGLTPLLFKGASLSYTLYPEPGLRPRCDTDLLIPEADREKTAELMKRSGYTALHEAEVDYISTQMCYSKKTGHGISCSYDIHRQVSNCNRRFSRDFADEKLFEHAEAVPSLGENARTLNKVDALILSCFHRAGHFSHSGDRLIWLYDIHLLCQGLTAQETAAFYRRAEELKIIALCADAITVARSWFGTVLSQEFEAILLEEKAGEASALLLGTNRADGIRRHTLLELKGLSTWRERFSYILQNLFPPPKFMFWRYQEKKKVILPWLYVRRLAEGISIILRK